VVFLLGVLQSPTAPSPDVYYDRTLLLFADLVGKKTNGALRVDVYPASQLGSMNQMIKGLPAGLVDFIFDSVGRFSMFEKDFRLFDLPYFIDNWDQGIKILDSPVGQELFERVKKKTGIIFLNYHHKRTPRHLFTTNKPVFTPDDMKGLKIRVKKMKQFTYYWERVGAVPISVNYGELYMALAQGMVDACEGLITNIQSMKFYEPAKYATLIGYTYELFGWMMSEKKFNSFSPEIQKAIMEAVSESTEYANKWGFVEDETAREILKKEGGMAIIDVDTEPFKKKAEGLAQQLEDEGEWGKGLYEKVSKIR